MKKVFVAMARNYARVWTGDLESHSKPLIIQEPVTSKEYLGQLDRFFSGRNRAKLAPTFVSKLYSQVKDAEEIFLVGAGKGKSSAVGGFVSHLRKYHPEVAERVRRIERVDLESMSEPEILDAFRKMALRP